MPDHLGKPFTSQELWRVLLKHLTPVSKAVIDDQSETDDLQDKLLLNFVKRNQTTDKEIVEAINAGDIKLAHRLAHTLCGNAGMIGRHELRDAARAVEIVLKDGNSVGWEAKMVIVEKELALVLRDLQPLLDEKAAAQVKSLDNMQIEALFDKLEPMLENINPECMSMLDDLHAIPEASELAALIEDFNFAAAIEELAAVRRKRGG
jgi:HPt (histidine-containing phosphotransfer) domain-containing protein